MLEDLPIWRRRWVLRPYTRDRKLEGEEHQHWGTCRNDPGHTLPLVCTKCPLQLSQRLPPSHLVSSPGRKVVALLWLLLTPARWMPMLGVQQLWDLLRSWRPARPWLADVNELSKIDMAIYWSHTCRMLILYIHMTNMIQDVWNCILLYFSQYLMHVPKHHPYGRLPEQKMSLPSMWTRCSTRSPNCALWSGISNGIFLKIPLPKSFSFQLEVYVRKQYISDEWKFPILFYIPCLASKPIRSRACAQLNSDIAVLDDDYNKLSEHVAKGERDDHNEQYPNCKYCLIVILLFDRYKYIIVEPWGRHKGTMFKLCRMVSCSSGGPSKRILWWEPQPFCASATPTIPCAMWFCGIRQLSSTIFFSRNTTVW